MLNHSNLLIASFIISLLMAAMYSTKTIATLMAFTWLIIATSMLNDAFFLSDYILVDTAEWEHLDNMHLQLMATFNWIYTFSNFVSCVLDLGFSVVKFRQQSKGPGEQQGQTRQDDQQGHQGPRGLQEPQGPSEPQEPRGPRGHQEHQTNQGSHWNGERRGNQERQGNYGKQHGGLNPDILAKVVECINTLTKVQKAIQEVEVGKQHNGHVRLNGQKCFTMLQAAREQVGETSPKLRYEIDCLLVDIKSDEAFPPGGHNTDELVVRDHGW